MEDQLRFTAQRRGDYVAAICTGYDRFGQPVDFELDAAGFKANSRRQVDWATEVNAVANLMQALIKIGVTPDRAWETVEHVLPDDMRMGTGWRSPPVDQGAADLGDEQLEGADDAGWQPSDGDH